MSIAKFDTVNPVKRKQYSVLSQLTHEQQEAICDLLAENTSDVIYRFLEMFEENDDTMRLELISGEGSYNILNISEKMGSEIVDENGWIQKYSKINHFIL